MRTISLRIHKAMSEVAPLFLWPPCIVPVREENIDAWLNPDPMNLSAQMAILDDRERPYYEHQLVA